MKFTFGLKVTGKCSGMYAHSLHACHKIFRKPIFCIIVRKRFSIIFTKTRMNLLMSVLIYVLAGSSGSKVHGIPVDTNTVQSDDQQFVKEYETLKHVVIYDLGYTKEFADMVEVNLKRAIREEKERQKQQGVVPMRLRQGNQGAAAAASEEYDEEETTPGPTTPGASPGDVVRGVAGILTGLGTLNVRNFWQSFVNFFPPNQREGAQAVVEASLGRRPAQWPTLPTTKLTTTTNSNELDSDETTKRAVTSVPAIAAAPAAVSTASLVTTSAPAGATPGSVQVANPAAVTEVAMKAPTTKYTLIRRRTATVLPDTEGLRVDDILLLGASSLPEKNTPATKTNLLP